jgi:hypothetical protein
MPIVVCERGFEAIGTCSPRCLRCVPQWHVTLWKALSVDRVGQFSLGPGRAVGEIALDQVD